MRIERHSEATGDLVDEILAFLETQTADEADALGEAKRAQLVPGAGHWSGVLAREEEAGIRPSTTDTDAAEGEPATPGDGVRPLVGYAHVRWEPLGEDPRASAELVVAWDRPDREEVGKTLLDEVRDLVAEAGGGVLYVWSHRVREAAATLPAAAGFRVQRRLAVMERPLPDRPDVDPPAEGVALRPYRPDADDAEVIRVNNEAFAGHPEQGGWDTATLADRRSRDWFDPEGVITAWRGDRLLGFHWTKVHDGAEPTGEVYVLGVGPDAQGLGLGRTLLDAGLAHLHDRGCRRAILYVDMANSGAVRLYETSGFRAMYLEVCYEDEIPPAA